MSNQEWTINQSKSAKKQLKAQAEQQSLASELYCLGSHVNGDVTGEEKKAEGTTAASFSKVFLPRRWLEKPKKVSLLSTTPFQPNKSTVKQQQQQQQKMPSKDCKTIVKANPSASIVVPAWGKKNVKEEESAKKQEDIHGKNPWLVSMPKKEVKKSLEAKLISSNKVISSKLGVDVRAQPAKEIVKADDDWCVAKPRRAHTRARRHKNKSKSSKHHKQYNHHHQQQQQPQHDTSYHCLQEGSNNSFHILQKQKNKTASSSEEAKMSSKKKLAPADVTRSMKRHMRRAKARMRKRAQQQQKEAEDKKLQANDEKTCNDEVPPLSSKALLSSSAPSKMPDGKEEKKIAHVNDISINGSSKKMSRSRQRHLRRKRAAMKKQQQKLLIEVEKHSALMAVHTETSAKETAAKQLSETFVTKSAISRSSRLDNMPYPVLVGALLNFLEPEDLARLGATSKTMLRVCEDGALWKALFSLRYTPKDLSKVSMGAWKKLYLLHINKAIDRMRCFATKQHLFEDVLGIPLVVSVNPLKKKIDYIHSNMQFLSFKGYKCDKIRRDAFGEKFSHWLPMYFTEDHFSRALPHIKRSIVSLCPHAKSSTFSPLMVLDVLPKLMTTFIVLLSDRGVSACEKALNGFTAVHRLFLALANRYPELRKAVDAKLERFALKSSNRHKSQVASLGDILPLLTISDRFKWRDFWRVYLGESFDRAVLWIGKEDPSILKLPKAEELKDPAKREAIDDDLLEKSYKASRVRNRMSMFMAYFLRTFCCGTTEAQCNRYDRVFCRPDMAEAILEEANQALEQATTEASPPVEEEKEEDGGSTGPVEEAETKQAEAKDGENDAATENVVSGWADEAVTVEADKKQPKPCATKSPHPPSSSSSPVPTQLPSVASMQAEIAQILKVQSWHEYFERIGAVPPSSGKIADILRQSVRNSLRKGYHTKNTKFHLIQKSGVSKILLKGESVAIRGLRKGGFDDLVFTDSWEFEGGVKYLDATCFIYDKKGEVLDHVDYTKLRGSGLRHSGDIMGHHVGYHEITVNRSQLPPSADSLVFVLSAWQGVKLKQIKNPRVRCCESDLDSDGDRKVLCQYDHTQAASGDKTAVIMCRLHKVEDGDGNTGWHVQAIGEMCFGYATQYGAIKRTIATLMR
eukprot:jgi/Bigna1/90953/estExt_fgenesh1_pg.C_830090